MNSLVELVLALGFVIGLLAILALWTQIEGGRERERREDERQDDPGCSSRGR